MTANEKKLIVIGALAGILSTVVIAGIFAARGSHVFASPTTLTMQPDATRNTRPDPQSGTQPGTAVELSPSEITAAGVQVADVRTAMLKTDIDAFGRVEQPEAQLAAVSAWIGGRVDKLYVQYTGERVHRGQAIADLYSPEVATAIEEYRLAQENRKQLSRSDDPYARTQADALIAASQRKLELWGIGSKQIDTPASSGIPHVTIYANANGTVVDRKITQGQYVNSGETLFTIADLSHVWIKADVFEEQLAQIRPGQQVDITAEALPGRTLRGNVDFIEPAANPQTRTVPVHVHLANPGMRLVPGMFVSATFISRSTQSTIVVPRSAVLDTGTRKLVYLAHPNGVFEAREVAVGAPSEDLYPILSGLHLGDKVVLSGNFLIDSQAQLSSGMSGLYGGSKEYSGGQQAQSTAKNGQSPNGTESTQQSKSSNSAKLVFRAEPETLKVGEDALFHATLTDASGKPISNARVTVTLVMPGMPEMNMPEMKSSVDLSWMPDQQMYMGKGQAAMPGSWNVFVEAHQNGAVIASIRTHLSAR